MGVVLTGIVVTCNFLRADLPMAASPRVGAGLHRSTQPFRRPYGPSQHGFMSNGCGHAGDTGTRSFDVEPTDRIRGRPIVPYTPDIHLYEGKYSSVMAIRTVV